MIRRFCTGEYTDTYKKTIGVDFLEKEKYIDRSARAAFMPHLPPGQMRSASALSYVHVARGGICDIRESSCMWPADCSGMSANLRSVPKSRAASVTFERAAVARRALHSWCGTQQDRKSLTQSPNRKCPSPCLPFRRNTKSRRARGPKRLSASHGRCLSSSAAGASAVLRISPPSVMTNLRVCRYYRGAHGCVIAFSTTDRDSFEAVEKWKGKVEAEVGAIAMVLVQNKVDLIDKAVSSKEEVPHCCCDLSLARAHPPSPLLLARPCKRASAGGQARLGISLSLARSLALSLSLSRARAL
jgi:hypothetical protein